MNLLDNKEIDIKRERKINVYNRNRDTNFEFMRIVSMILIIIYHSIFYSNVLEKCQISKLSYYFLNVITYICLVGVNCFVMMTGYYMVKSKIKLKKIFFIELEVIFYALLGYIISIICKNASLMEFISCIFPFTTRQYWFVTAYLALYLLIPYINRFIYTLSKKQYQILIILLIILLSIIKTIYPINNILEANNGYGLMWFIFLYLLAAYIRLHYQQNITKTKFLLMYIFIISIQIYLLYIYNSVNIDAYIYQSRDYNSFFVLLSSICFFMFFKNFKIKNTIANKVILAFAPLTFGIYLIHDNRVIAKFLWNNSIGIFDMPIIQIFIIIIIRAFMIFIVCSLIEKVRQIIFRFIEKTKFINKISNKLDDFENKIF